jgi:hypothetical protein
LNSSGVLQWQKCLGGSSTDKALSIAQTADGGFIVAGSSSSNDGDVSGNHGGWDYWVVKLNSSGDIVWQKCLGGSNYDWATSIAQTSDGGFIVAGVSHSNDGDVSGNHGERDYWIVKLSPETNGIAESPLPEQFSINIAPNPFNSAVTIAVDGVGAIHELPLQIEIFDLAGHRVAQLPAGGTVGAGFTPARNDGANNNERDGARPSPTTREFIWQPDASIPSGVYLVRATVGDESVTKRIVYLK